MCHQGTSGSAVKASMTCQTAPNAFLRISSFDFRFRCPSCENWTVDLDRDRRDQRQREELGISRDQKIFQTKRTPLGELLAVPDTLQEDSTETQRHSWDIVSCELDSGERKGRQPLTPRVQQNAPKLLEPPSHSSGFQAVQKLSKRKSAA